MDSRYFNELPQAVVCAWAMGLTVPAAFAFYMWAVMQ